MSSDTTPLLSGHTPRRTSIPNSRSATASFPSSYNNNNGINPGTNSTTTPNPNSQRHWSEETEDISGPDPNAYGHQNTGAGYRRRGPPPPIHPGSGVTGAGSPYYGSADLDAQRFLGQDRPTGLKRLLCGCCCLPCQRAWIWFQNKYSRTEKCLMAIAAVWFLLAVGFLCAFVRAKDAIPEGGKNGICTSRECTIIAADILRDMKPGVDPCDDFFDFNCGGFVERVPIPDDKAQVGYFNLVKKQNQELIRSILLPDANKFHPDSGGGGGGGKDDPSRRNLAKLQSLYESCIDEKKMSEVGVKPLADIVRKMVKIFPMPSSVLANINNEEDNDEIATSLELLRDINGLMALGTPDRTSKLEIGRTLGQQRESLENYYNVDEGEYQKPKYQQIPPPVNVFLDRRQTVKRSSESFVRAGREELALVISQLEWLGVATMVEFDVAADPKNPEENVLQMGESGLGLPSKQYYDEDKIVNVYQTTIEDMFRIVMGKDKVPEDAIDILTDSPADGESYKKPPVVWAEVAKNVVEFEKLLAAISSDQEDLDNSELTYNPRTLAEISELIPAIDWALVLEKLFGAGTQTPNPIIISMPEYLEKLNALIHDTPALTLQNYFAWRLIHRLSPYLGVEFRKPMLQLKAALQGVSADLVTPRWETCIDVVDTSLGAMAGHYFIERSFKGDSKERADDIINSLRSSFVKKLSQLEWLDHDTLRNATEKVDLLIQKIGYSVESPDVRSSEQLEAYYKDLEIEKADFFGNQIRSRTWSTRQTLQDLTKPVDKAKWLMSPQTVNAYYNPSVNEIVFPAGILQQPFFHSDTPEYLNYGGIGVVAGHELTHAFDNEGRLYDARGKLSDWWSNSTLQEFQQRSQCFIDQYGNFTVKDPQGRENHVNGKLTLGENLADNGGLKRSFDAWHARYKSDLKGNK
ncbi:hypothetical protein BGZ98_007402 [Dissophora globulifera]|nr:hypothetical protein BGZ98_007402 [Dissophora globulifera]